MNSGAGITNIKLIAIYARVSTARQEEDGTIETQLRALREFAQQNNFVVVQEYIDDGWSGDILARPSLDQLRADVTKKLWQAVLIYDPDRLARRYSYQELVMDELRERHIEVLFVTVSAPKNSEEKILHGVRGLFAEYERAKIAERFRLGKLRKVKDGHILLSEAPYGYIYIPNQGDRHGYLELLHEEARVVRMVFEWVANERLTLRHVVRRLQEIKIRPRKSARGVWNTSTLSTLLRNEAYIGEAHWGSTYAVAPEHPLKKDTYRKIKKSSRRTRPRTEWVIVTVPSIIDRALFERAGAQLDANYALSKRNKKNEYLLAGRIRCVCGRSRTGEGVLLGKHLYYRCSDRVLSFPLRGVCKERGINARIGDQLVWDKIVDLMSSPELMLSQVERWIDSKQDKAANSTSDVRPLENELASLGEQLGRHNRAYGAGLFTIEQLREYTQPIKDRIAAVELQISNSKGDTLVEKKPVLPQKEELELFADEARNTLHNLSFSQKRAILLNTVDKIVGTPSELQIYGAIPIENHVEFKTSHRHGQDATRHRIPFEFRIELPPPRTQRVILARTEKGRIISTAPPPAANGLHS
ncbi:recombinase family protein [Bradyrhizobium diazoefficiens]|uniref:recombinase family protein n=1 Tax=Bradyrhizobium diazoefficiens TaxID=1355477 RepID=UPI00272D8EA3|nr:recombinase family protein [Bradyrhizobium diazoefficiens]WLA73368.1 recombinase family protein [Bradyrhizobium diazoefficiens]